MHAIARNSLPFSICRLCTEKINEKETKRQNSQSKKTNKLSEPFILPRNYFFLSFSFRFLTIETSWHLAVEHFWHRSKVKRSKLHRSECDENCHETRHKKCEKKTTKYEQKYKKEKKTKGRKKFMRFVICESTKARAKTFNEWQSHVDHIALLLCS